jgi:hypothetical protein
VYDDELNRVSHDRGPRGYEISRWDVLTEGKTGNIEAISAPCEYPLVGPLVHGAPDTNRTTYHNDECMNVRYLLPKPGYHGLEIFRLGEARERRPPGRPAYSPRIILYNVVVGFKQRIDEQLKGTGWAASQWCHGE